MKELITKINKEKLMRTHGFPFIMPIANQYNGDWDKAEPLISHIVHTHVELKYTEILKKLDKYYTKMEIKKAFVSIIHNDFFKLGYKREQYALACLKTKYPDITWVGDLEYDYECWGIDILGTKGDVLIGVSVKGYKFDRTGSHYEKHTDKLRRGMKKNIYKHAMLAMTNAEEGKIKWSQIK